jgi:hypothetical protein
METRMKSEKLFAAFLIIVLLLPACSPIMAANRSSYRGDVGVIKEGVDRGTVIAELGEPDNFNKAENGGYEDKYTLDPDAHRTAVKVLTVIFHLGADLVTLCLWEVVGTPYELAVRDRLATYDLKYNENGKLASFEKRKS